MLRTFSALGGSEGEAFEKSISSMRKGTRGPWCKLVGQTRTAVVLGLKSTEGGREGGKEG